jgi:hypothetical protein
MNSDFNADHTHLAKHHAFTAYLRPLRRAEWVVYSKHPIGGPEAVLAYRDLEQPPHHAQ